MIDEFKMRLGTFSTKSDETMADLNKIFSNTENSKETIATMLKNKLFPDQVRDIDYKGGIHYQQKLLEHVKLKI